MDEIELQKMLFRPVANRGEIERIFNVKSARDYLLKLRAETIVDHMRLFRVYRNKALLNEANWSLEESFDSSHYTAFLSALPEDVRKQCEQITYGNVFSNDPNGSTFETDYGPIVTISDSLRFFLKFCHLAVLDFGSKVPMHVRFAALRIAIRVMLMTEALDFFMNPRGIVPYNVGQAIEAPIPFQMEFFAGHEFAHYVLGHLSESNVSDKPILCAISSEDKDYKPMKVYNRSQKQELEADAQAILLPQYDSAKRLKILESALMWFGCLELYEVVCEKMCPSSLWLYQAHPKARDRFENLLARIPSPSGFSHETWKDFPHLIDKLKKALMEYVSSNFDVYLMYGSVYLDKPNSEWRGKELIDPLITTDFQGCRVSIGKPDDTRVATGGAGH